MRRKWNHIYVKDRDLFSKSATRKIKRAVGLSMHDERTKLIDEKSKHADFPTNNNHISIG